MQYFEFWNCVFMYYETDISEEYVVFNFGTEESSPSWSLSLNMDHNINVQKCVLLPILSHNCKSWSVTLE
jgi:hypothetical protein